MTRVAGPALAHVLPRVAGVVAELGGSTSHLASLARQRGIPMVLGVLDATQEEFPTAPGRGGWRCRHRAVDRLMATRIFVTQPIAESALARLRAVAEVTVNPDMKRVLARDALIAAVRGCDILLPLLHDHIDRDVIAANPTLPAP